MIRLDGILRRLQVEGVLALYLDFRAGLYSDLSGSGNNPTITLNTRFTKHGLLYRSSNSAVEIPSSAALESSSGTMIIRVIRPGANDFINLMSKDTGASRQMNWRYSIFGSDLVLEDNGVDPFLVSPTSGVNTHAVSFTNGAAPVGYKNGVGIGTYTGNYTHIPRPGVNLVIGNYTTSGFNANIGTVYEYFLFITRQLTATEHSEIYRELQRL